MSTIDDFIIVPFSKHSTENKPRLFLQKRPKFAAEIKLTLTALSKIGAHDYAEIYIDKAKKIIKIVPVEKQTAYSRSVTTDAIAWGRLGGANMLIELGMPIGIYEMEAPLEFVYKTNNINKKHANPTGDHK